MTTKIYSERDERILDEYQSVRRPSDLRMLTEKLKSEGITKRMIRATLNREGKFNNNWATRIILEAGVIAAERLAIEAEKQKIINQIDTIKSWSTN